MASKHTTIYLDDTLWQDFRLACLGKHISASRVVTDLIAQQLTTWGQASPAVMAAEPLSTAKEGTYHGDLC